MNRILVACVMLLVMGCHPREGDWYENIRTGHRIKIIAIDQGYKLRQMLQGWCDSSNANANKFNVPALENVTYDESDSLLRCFCYDYPIFEYQIEPLKALEDYRRIEAGG